MSLPYDATLKDMARENPPRFLSTFASGVHEPVTLLNVDLSTVTTTTDLVFGLGDPLDEVIHIECQASASETLHRDLLARNALLHRHYRVPVHSIVLLLRSEASHRTLTGNLRYRERPGRGKMDFEYGVINLWERPAEALLAGPLATVPLAVLGQLATGVPLADALAPIAHRLVERLTGEASQDQARRLLTSAFVLSGMRVQRTVARTLFMGVQAMRESDTYMAILEEGEITGAFKVFLRLGRKCFGEPDAATMATLRAITEVERFERLNERVPGVSSWQELLQTP